MSNYLSGKKVVVTGIVAGHSRGTAEAALHDAGADVQAKVGPTTDLLICGGKVGASKLSKAKALGVQIISWEGAFSPSPIQAAGLSVQEAAEAQEYVEENGESVRTIAPMLAKAGDLPTDDGWQFEVKWDGYRGVATVRDGRCVIQSRSAKSHYTEQFPDIVRELEALPDCVIDGELVVLDDNGGSSMENMGKGEASYIVFDALEIMGEDIRREPLHARREMLEMLLSEVTTGGSHISTSPVFDDGEALLAWGAEQQIEGIVAKRLSSQYKEGSRGGDWLKIKLRCEQEFAVVGWIPGEGARDGTAGSLLLAVYEDGVPCYVGRVGTGGDHEQWESFTERPFGLAAAASVQSLVVPKPVARQTVWVDPFVVQVRFQRWTEDGMLWHPSLIAVRDDKSPEEVIRERDTCAAH